MSELNQTEVELKVATAQQMVELGRNLGAQLRAGDIVVLNGDLGAGKTTFTRGLGVGLQVRGPVQSPTFVIARSHPSLVGGAALVHVDAYRLVDSAALDDLDLDYLNSVVVVEWGGGMFNEQSRLEVSIDRKILAVIGPINPIDFDADGARTVTLTGFGARWVKLVSAFYGC